MPLPRRDSSYAILKDLFGTSRNISVSGIVFGTEAEQDTFIQAMETIVNGRQASSTFTSSVADNTYTVFVQTFGWSKDKADPSKITYSLSMVEGAVSS